jgi:hypothetical protein
MRSEPSLAAVVEGGAIVADEAKFRRSKRTQSNAEAHVPLGRAFSRYHSLTPLRMAKTPNQANSS